MEANTIISKKSMVQAAYELMRKKKKPITFAKLWNETSQVLGLTSEQAEELISEFYTELTLDGRIVTLGENIWDLRERNTYDKVHIDMNDVYGEDEEEEEESKDLDEDSEDSDKKHDDEDWDEEEDY